MADVLVRRGVRFLFTLCGGHISPILVAAKARGLRVVDTRHEATAVFAADAVARLTGVPGVAAVTAGPGVTNTITALKNAQMAQSPLVLVGGATATLLRGRGALQDIDQMALVRPHVKWATRVARVRELAPVLERGLPSGRGRACPARSSSRLPVDLLYPEALVREWYGAKTGGAAASARGAAPSGWYVGRHLEQLFRDAGRRRRRPRRRAPAAPEPDEARVRRAARLVAERRAAGAPRRQPGAPRRAGARRSSPPRSRALGVPVYLSGMARGLLGRDDPLQLRHRRKEALREADLVILAGLPCRLPARLRPPHRPPRACSCRANRSRGRDREEPPARPRGAGRARPLPDRASPRAAGPAARPWAPWLATLRGRDAARDAEIAAQAAPRLRRRPQPARRCAGRSTSALADDERVVADGGDFVATASYVLRPRGPLSLARPRRRSARSASAPASRSARSSCRPDADVWILYGDGSVGYSLAEFDTFVRHGLARRSRSSATTPAGRRSRASRSRSCTTTSAPSSRRRDYERAAEGLGARGLPLRDARDDGGRPRPRRAGSPATAGRST